MRQTYRVAGLGSNSQIAAAGSGSEKMKGFGTSTPVLSHWWRRAAALSAAFAAVAGFTDNRTLAFVTAGLCAALIVHAAATVWSSQGRS
jgi:hypothetical protein